MTKRKLGPSDSGEPQTFDMTPMIDVTFQLLIFFMLVMDMSRQQTEDLTVPTASRALKDAIPEENLLVINIMGNSPDGADRTNGTVRVHGKTLDDNALQQLFQQRRQKFPERGGTGANYPVLIRADISTRWEHVQKVMMLASAAGGVARVELGAKKHDAN